MSDKNEQLEPTPFELATPSQPAGTVPPTGTPPWVLPALGGLLLVALLVFFWLPSQVTDTDVPPAVNDAETRAGQASTGQPQQPAAAAGTDASPWSDAQAAKLRKEAQDRLQELLDLQFTLEERGAPLWAQDAWTAAAETAKSGDELYRQREYVAAKDRYTQGLQQLQAIEAAIPDTIATQLDTANEALESGAIEPLDDALALLALIDPENEQLPALQQRARTLPELLEKLEAAAAAENDRDLATAQSQLRAANALDPLHQRTASELERVSALYLDQRFNDAMSDGYIALDENKYDQARQQFRQAAGLKPGSAEASSALQETDAAQQASRLAAFKRQGSAEESNEQWEAAVKAYQQALELDSTLLFAREGLKRSQARARLDKQFEGAIAEPQRLSDVAVAEATEKLLQQARTISPRGPLLDQQISSVTRLLQQYNTLVPVTFRSDGETEVIVYKVARLGRFQATELTLRPGTYQVRGSRRGYRDTLQSFEVLHDAADPVVTVSCTERIL